MSDRYAGDVFWFTSNWDSTGMQNAVVLDGQTLPIDSNQHPSLFPAQVSGADSH